MKKNKHMLAGSKTMLSLIFDDVDLQMNGAQDVNVLE